VERCGFFDANLVGEEYDRVYLASQFAAYFASFIGNGVFAEHSNQLQVMEMATSQMQIGVERGQAWINGYWYENTDILYLPIDVADGVLNRIDSVVLRFEFSERNMRLAVKKGTPAINPIAPEVTRTADYYELQLATISIPAGSIKITQAQITDTRMNQDVCGWVTGVVKQLDTTTLFNQFESYFDEFKQFYENDYANWTAEQKQAYITWVTLQENDYTNWTNEQKAEYDEWYASHIDLWQNEFTTWFVGIKEILDENAAAKLLTLISDLDVLKADRSVIRSATLSAANWSNTSPYKQTVAVDGVTAQSINEILPGTHITDAQLLALQNADLRDGGQSEGSITVLAAKTKPTVDIPLTIVVGYNRSTSLSQKFTGIYYAKDYGLDNEADDNADVLNELIKMVNSVGGGMIIMPTGQYKIKKPITLLSNVSIEGQGPSTGFVVNADIDCFNTNYQASRFSIGNFSIDGNRDNITFSSGGCGLKVNISHVTVHDIVTRAIAKVSCMVNYEAPADTSRGETGFLVRITRNSFEESLEEGIKIGYRLTDSWITYNNVGSDKANLYLEGFTFRIIGNHFDGNPEYNVYVPSGCKDVNFANNIFENSKKHSIYITCQHYENSKSQTVFFTGNQIKNCGTDNKKSSVMLINGNDTWVNRNIVIANNNIEITTDEHYADYLIKAKGINGLSISGNGFLGMANEKPILLADSVTNFDVIGNCGINTYTQKSFINLLNKSQDLKDNTRSTTWQTYDLTVGYDETAADPFGGTGVNTLLMQGSYAKIQQAVVNLKPSTEYYFSFYVKSNGGTGTDISYAVIKTNDTDFIISPTSYYSKLSTAWTRVSTSFTTDADTTEVLICPVKSLGNNNISGCNVLLTGVMLSEGSSLQDYEESFDV